jgi:prepilin-type processing-associated H-X9-DG protein
MKANVIGNGVVIVAICAAIALPLMASRNAATEAQAKDDLLRKQKEAIEGLTAVNANQKKQLAGKNAGGLTDEQLKELLRLRAEAGALRKATNNLDKFETASDVKLTTEQQAERAQQLSAELLDAARRLVAGLPEAERRFWEKKGFQPDFPDLRDYFPKVNGKRMPGAYTFGFIRMGGPKPGDNLVLLELNTHETADGKLARTYAFADGHAEEVVAPDRDNVDSYFTAWVKENWGAASNPPEQ